MRDSKLFLVLLIALVFSATAAFAVDHKFVGVGTCKMCHKAQYEVWAGSAHAKAMQAAKVADDPKCIKCHQTAFGADAALLDPKFDKTQGVQCEACHGAGGDYKAMASMKDHAKAVAAGLNPIKVADGSAEKLCVTCHNAQSPTFKGFKFEEYWAKIKHGLPAK